jgi:zinc transport system substrate-binding protein
MHVAKNIRATALAVLVLVSAMPLGQALAEKPSVVVSLPPIHSLVAGVMGKIAKPRLMLRGGRSPHDAVLKPSDLRRLRTATLIVWVSPALENFLAKPIAAIRGKTTILTLLDLPALKQLSRRTSGAWKQHDHHHEAPRGLSDAVIDPHLWLSPANAASIAKSVADVLKTADPDNAATYSQNTRDLIKRIEAMGRELETSLAPVSRTPYLVFHDAYQYFERHFDLMALGAISISPDRRPGARRIAEIRRQIQESDVRCVFREPQFPPRMVRTITTGTSARIGLLDPLGSAIQPGPDQWFELMSGLGAALVNCLSAKS